LDHAWVYFIFYIWVSIYAVLGTSQFWLLANTIFDPAQAKRVFWFLNLGGILGAMTGGEVTSLIIRHLGVQTENLLFVCMGLLACCLLILNAIAMVKRRTGVVHESRVPPEELGSETFGLMIGTIRRSKQLTYMVGILSIGMMVATFVDFQFKTVSVEAFPEKEDLTAFLGRFYSRLSVVSLVIQSLFTYRVLRMFGVGGAIGFLPVGLFVGSIGMVIMPGLWMGVLLRGTDGSFRYSIDKTGRELLYLPLPLEVKKRIKIFIDMFLDRLFRGIGGGLLLVFTVVLELSMRQISLVVLPLLGVWIFLTVFVRREYVSAFRKALERRDIDPNELKMDITEAATVEALVSALRSPNERLLVYALDMLASVEHVELVQAVQPLLRHSSREVRLKAVRLLKTQDPRALIPDLEELLHDRDSQVRREAVSILLQREKRHDPTRIREYLDHQDLKVQAAAVQYIAESGSPEEQRLIGGEVIERLLAWEGKDTEAIRAQVMSALGALSEPSLCHFLLEHREDPSPLVVKAVIRSAGRMRDRQFVAWLLTKLSTTQFRAEARNALTAFNPHILGTLHDYLTDETVYISVRMNIPRVFSAIPTQESVHVLMRCVKSVDPVLKYHVIKALNKLRGQYPELRFDKQQVDMWLIEETKSYYENLQILHLYREVHDGPAADLLKRALYEKMNQNIEIMFRLLGLCYPPKDMYSAYWAFVGREKRMRANAIEFLDSILRKDSKRYILPILDEISEQHMIQKGWELFEIRIEERGEALATLMQGRDSWLKACAMFTLLEFHTGELLNFAKQASHDPDPVVRETANLVLRRLDQ
ncbi:MAG: Npt1/Npt2 family nucleotide transporter, partial [Nitrospirota bacterium]|nr:Npt1/Npt2 family nucleotide transporter [Nitrospirota bacterium]